MPKIHKYKSKAGFYIKSAVNGSMTTYQVTEEGNNYLKSRGYKDQDEIDINYLMQLKDWNYVFTYGQGPGDIDTEQTYIGQKKYGYQHKHQTNAQLSDGELGCLWVIIIIILIYIISLF
jgi:hypothetical protein